MNPPNIPFSQGITFNYFPLFTHQGRIYNPIPPTMNPTNNPVSQGMTWNHVLLFTHLGIAYNESLHGSNLKPICGLQHLLDEVE